MLCGNELKLWLCFQAVVVLFSGLFITKLKPARLYIITNGGSGQGVAENHSVGTGPFPQRRLQRRWRNFSAAALKMMFTYVVLNREV